MSKEKNELAFMPTIADEWLADRAGLSLEAFGAFCMIRLCFWRWSGKAATLDEVRAWSGAGKRWGAIKGQVLDRFTVIEGRVSCKSVLERLHAARARRQKAAQGGHAKAQKQARAGTSEGGLNASYEGRRSSAKPLKSNKPTPFQAASKHMLGTCNENQNGEKTAIVMPAADALEVDGTLTVRLRLDIPSAEARKHIARWCAALNDDAKLLGIIHAAAERGLKGPTYLRVVTEAVNRETTARMKQHVLPLPPVQVSGSRK